jgi:hypothetical protein
MEKYKRHRRNVNKAFRLECSEEISGWKEDHLSEIWRGINCPVTGVRLSRRKAEADHFPVPFQNLVDDFLASEGLEFEHVLTYYDTTFRRHRLADPDLTKKWRDYHKKHAALRGSPQKATKNKEIKGT